MSKGDLELEKKKKPVEIMVTRDAEDGRTGISPTFMPS